MSLTTIDGADSIRASRAVINANFTYLESISASGIYGSASLNFPSITAGDYAELTFTVTGAIGGRPVSPGWPASLEAGLIGMMWVSAIDTVKIRLLNVTGADIDPAIQTFSAKVL